MPSPSQRPAVSVIVPCYNQRRFLRRAIDSVQAQTFPDWECIIVNDGSTDETATIARRLCAADGRLRYLEHPNRGLAATRNRALDRASGAYIQFLDSDDTLAHNKFATQLALLAGVGEPSVAYCNYLFCDANDTTRFLKRGTFDTPTFIMSRPLCDLALRWETEFGIPIHCFLFDSRLFTRTGLRFDESLPNHEDWHCWMQLFALEPRLVKAEARLATYMIHGASMSSKGPQMQAGFLKACRKLERMFRDNDEIHDLLVTKRKALLRAHRKHRLNQAWHAVPAGLQRRTPWPLQKLIRRLIAVE